MSAEVVQARVDAVAAVLDDMVQVAVTELASETHQKAIAETLGVAQEALRAVRTSELTHEGYLDLVVVAEEAVIAAATRLDRDRTALGRRLARRAGAAAAAMREVRSVAASSVPTRPEARGGEVSLGPLRASHRRPRCHELPTGAPAAVRPRRQPTVTTGDDVKRLIEDAQSALLEVASQVAGDGEAALGRLDQVLAPVRETTPAALEPRAPAGLVRLRRPIHEDTPGPEGRACQLRRLARTCLEELATAGLLRRRQGWEEVPRQILAFEARMLGAIDALVALGRDGATTIDIVAETMRWSGDGPATEIFRPFAQTLLLGCIDGLTAAELAVAALRTSDRDTLPVRVEALVLSVQPHLDRVLVRALVDARVEVLPAILEALTARGVDAEVRVGPLLRRGPLEVRAAAARALGVCRDRGTAAERLESLLVQETEDEVVVAAIEGLCRLAPRRARDEIRRRLDDDDASLSHHGRAALVRRLALTGDATDTERLVRTLRAFPRDAEAVGDHGAVGLVEPLLALLDEGPVVAQGAARSLARITGADPDDAEGWRSFWRDHRERFELELRYRQGEPWSSRGLVDAIVDLPVAALHRASSLRELEMATGLALPDPRSWTQPLHDRLHLLADELPADDAGRWPTLVGR